MVWADPGFGDGRTSHPVESRAAPPRDVTAEITDPVNGTFQVHWRDIRLTAQRPDSRLDRWRVIICSTEVAGNSSGGDQFADRVMRLGLGVNEQPIRGDGSIHEYTHSDIHLGDVWVVVVGVSETGLLGHPSTPILLGLEGPSTALPVVIPSATLTWLAKTVNGYDVLAIFPTYQSPFDMVNFYGMQLYAFNYFGDAWLYEMGNLNIFGSRTGGAYSSPWEEHLPQPVLASGRAVFTNGSTTVTYASGDLFFDVGMTGRWIFVKGFNVGDGTWTTYVVDFYTDPNTIDLTVAFAGTTGNYAWFVPNVTVFYFVAVNRNGARSATPTVGSPAVAI